MNKSVYCDREAVFRAFKLRAGVTVHLEDDTVPSPDALRYFDWAVRELLIPDVKSPDGCQILLASGYNKPKAEPRPDQSQGQPQYFLGIGLRVEDPIPVFLGSRHLACEETSLRCAVLASIAN